MTYTEAALVAVAVALLLDLAVLRTRLVMRRLFWVSYAIVLFFQLVVNGLLTGLKIVRYAPAQILGPRFVFAPVEDLLFGFSLVLQTLAWWLWWERRARRARSSAGRNTDSRRGTPTAARESST